MTHLKTTLHSLNIIKVSANNYSKLVVDRTHEDTGIAGRESTPREHLMWVVRKHDGDAGGGGGAESAVHDRFKTGAKAGQCKLNCLACAAAKASMPTAVDDDQARDGEFELVKWEVSEGMNAHPPPPAATPHRTPPHL